MKNKREERKGVLFLMPHLFMGGSEKQVRYIIEGLDEAGIPIIVLIENGNKKEEKNFRYVKQHSNIKFVFFNLNTESEQDKNIFNKTKSLCYILSWMFKNIKREKVNWVMFTNLTGLLTVPLCKMLNCKVLFNERNPGIKMCNNVIKRKLLLYCDKIVANSLSASNYMTQTLKVKVECINNGIKMLSTSDEKTKVYKSDEKIKILIPARVTPVKNQFVVLKAVKKLKNILPLEVQFVGQVEDEKYNQKLVSYIKENDIREEVKFFGYTNSIQDYYNQADLVILSSYEEGTPNVLLESYLNRKKCLASDIIMNRNVCVDTDILFSVDDANMLAKKILWILNLDRKETKEMLDNNYNFVCANYDLKKMQKKYIEIFSN